MTTTTANIDVPPGYWQREASHNPRPLTPLGASIFLDALNDSFHKVFAEFGLLLESMDYRLIGGYVYNAIKPLGGGGAGTLPPTPVLWLALRTAPLFRRRIAVCKRAIRGRLDRQLIERWYDEWRPQIETAIVHRRAVDLTAFGDDQLGAYYEDLFGWWQFTAEVHFLLAGANGYPIARLAFFCRDQLGYDDLQSMRFFSGLSGMSSEPSMALARLADRVRRDPAARDAVLAAAPERAGEALRNASSELATAFDEYVHAYGLRALRYEVVEPTLAEQPAILGQLLQDQLRQPVDFATRQQHLEEDRANARHVVMQRLHDPRLRARFEELLADAERAYPVREDNEFFTISVPLALLRLASLEAGRRLAAAGKLQSADDVFFLDRQEVIDGLRHRVGHLGDRIDARRQAFFEAEAWTPPPTYGEEPPIPPLGVLPREAREAMEIMLYVRDKVFEPEQSYVYSDGSSRELHGRGAARGTYSGWARIITDEQQFGKLRPGDVLVCPITSPVWSVLFGKVGALVTDSGGVLSHPAIIAGEYGIPAVVATGNATSIIQDGQRVTVDGDAGVVYLES
jgi:pyruvate,water dikinase